MNLREKLRRSTAFLMMLLMIFMLTGSSTEVVFAEETEEVQGVVEPVQPGESDEKVEEEPPGDLQETEPDTGQGEETESQPNIRSVTEWSWNDDRELLQWLEEEQRWELALLEVDEKNPVTREMLLRDYLPESIKGMVTGNRIEGTGTEMGENPESDETVETPEEMQLKLSWDLTGFPEEAWEGEYTITASVDPGFMIAEGVKPLEVTVILGGADLMNIQDHLVDSMTPKGTRINLFDYWSTDRYANDRESNADHGGINKGHEFKFCLGSKAELGDMNIWTGSSAPRKGIVKNKLDERGYPEFSGTEESLAYLFDPSIQHEGKASYPDAGELLLVDDEGYYYYNCQENYAFFNEETGNFQLYDKPGVFTGDSWSKNWTTENFNNGQFFPFNAAEHVFKKWVPWLEQERVNSKSKTDKNKDQASDDGFCDPPFNHYFGLSMSTQFIQKDDGYTDDTKQTKMTYEFSGDDDVWVFIDNVLVADLGGIHSKATLKIDFADGNIYINGSQNGNLRQKFKEAGVKGNFVPGKNIFANDTYHTLDFFYLERGNSDSNMRLKFNLVTVPESEIVKVDQIGEAVPGAEFALYHTSSDYKVDADSELIATGITDENGEFVLISPDGRLISLQNLNNYKEKYFVLRETTVPSGYRPAGNGDVRLYIPESVKYPVLLSTDSWNTGSRALAKLLTTVDPEITLVPDAGGSIGPGGNQQVNLGNGGTMFAVVLQHDDNGGQNDLTDPNSWHAVSGDPIGGWMVQDGSDMNSVLTAARQNPNVFQLDASGAYKAEVEELPGDVLKYYFMNSAPTVENTEYTVGYYYTTAGSVEGATVENTWRVQSDDFERMFAARLYVPNIENHLYVEKVDEAGQPVKGAEFGLYSATNNGVQ